MIGMIQFKVHLKSKIQNLRDTEDRIQVCALHCAMPLLAEWMMLPKMTALIALLYMLLCLPKIYTCLTIVSFKRSGYLVYSYRDDET